ncbi:hypothetical protein Acr_07g0005840 [Actinidia rufa]|uniref:K Homology domain-containing protein n=1 Tax=Actinidia rufa TaxID=165716 RepID=A0A7J0EXS2_9ERIC|nr:hypothetical protein Acr_07g0005840 [Actinidia rufa]
MAEPTETPALPTPAPEDTDKRSHPEKRPREEDGNDASGEARGDAPPAKRRMKSLLDIVYRIVVPSRQIGKVIGKVGARIQKIREETKATIKIADAIAVSPLNFFHLVPSVWLLGKCREKDWWFRGHKLKSHGEQLHGMALETWCAPCHSLPKKNIRPLSQQLRHLSSEYSRATASSGHYL